MKDEKWSNHQWMDLVNQMEPNRYAVKRFDNNKSLMKRIMEVSEDDGIVWVEREEESKYNRGVEPSRD